MCTCAPLPALRGSGSGVKLARHPRRRATSRTTSLSTTARSAALTPGAASTGISYWCGANSEKIRSGCTPASTSAPMTSAASGSRHRRASSEKGAGDWSPPTRASAPGAPSVASEEEEEEEEG
jgi:hypothetical protein